MMTMTSRIRIRGVAALLLLVLTAAACASGARSATQSTSGLAPSMVIERFLRAVNSNDLDTMASLFGDQAGPWSTTVSKKDADDRLYTIATILRHTDYKLQAEQIVPGRREEAIRLPVELVIKDKRHVLPITLVRYGNGWLIENIPLEVVTGAR
jgi:hypothetical protein